MKIVCTCVRRGRLCWCMVSMQTPTIASAVARWHGVGHGISVVRIRKVVIAKNCSTAINVFRSCAFFFRRCTFCFAVVHFFGSCTNFLYDSYVRLCSCAIFCRCTFYFAVVQLYILFCSCTFIFAVVHLFLQLYNLLPGPI